MKMRVSSNELFSTLKNLRSAGKKKPRRDKVHMRTSSSTQKHWEAVLLWMYMHNPKIPAWHVLNLAAFSSLSVLRQSVLQDPTLLAVQYRPAQARPWIELVS